ncbi:hypothetical protein [Pusillimonas sp.]|uniref:hypothetical protein n=1 Tax=Pusillimonas sp. TaxID=3040095 RepID=UPI0037CBF20B
MTLRKYPITRIWGVPIALIVLTCVGLLSALLGTGIWHWASWLCLAIPLGAGIGYWLRPRKKSPS